MPRFVARPVIVEAYQWAGHTHMLPEAFRRAVLRHLVAGMIEVTTLDGPRQCKHGDWIVHLPDSTFTVLRKATLERMFEEVPVPAPLPSSQPPTPTTSPIPGAARVDTRRKVHA